MEGKKKFLDIEGLEFYTELLMKQIKICDEEAADTAEKTVKSALEWGELGK